MYIQEDICDLEDLVCNPVGLGVIESFTNITSIQDCKRKCVSHDNCNFTTYSLFRGTPKCSLLSSCDVKVPACKSPMICLSSARQCSHHDIKSVCQKLPYPKYPKYVALWTCEDGINPYKQEIPDKTICTSICQEGDEDKKTPILFSSECKLSKWSKPMKISNSGRKVSRDTSQLLPGLRQYKCKFPVNKTEIDESFCAMLKKVTKLSFFEDLFVKHFCLKYE